MYRTSSLAIIIFFLGSNGFAYAGDIHFHCQVLGVMTDEEIIKGDASDGVRSVETLPRFIDIFYNKRALSVRFKLKDIPWRKLGEDEGCKYDSRSGVTHFESPFGIAYWSTPELTIRLVQNPLNKRFFGNLEVTSYERKFYVKCAF